MKTDNSITRMFLLHVSLFRLSVCFSLFGCKQKTLQSYLLTQTPSLAPSCFCRPFVCLLLPSWMFVMQFPFGTFTTLLSYTLLGFFRLHFQFPVCSKSRWGNEISDNKGSWHVPMSISTELFPQNIRCLSVIFWQPKVLLLTKTRATEIRNSIFLSFKIGWLS